MNTTAADYTPDQAGYYDLDAEPGDYPGRLSFTGTAERPRALDIDQGGQMQDTIAQMPAEGLLILGSERDRLVELWERWHLNDMRAGCEHQRAEKWDEHPHKWERPDDHPEGRLTRPCPACGYRYGTAWLHEDVPDEVIEELRTFPAAGIN